MKSLISQLLMCALSALFCTVISHSAHAAELTISATGVRLPEGNSGRPNAQFRVLLSETPAKEVRVAFSTQPGTATAGRDFVSSKGTLVFASGVREQVVSIPIISDTIPERDESFFLYLNASGYTIAQPAAACTLTNDDTPTASTTGAAKIIYQVNYFDFQIWAMNVDGSNQTCLTPETGFNSQHDVSPDGSKIAYVVYDYTTKVDDIWLMNADGSHKTRLTRGPGFNQYPVWSPDGKTIAFRSNREGDFALYTMSANGGRQLRIAAMPKPTSPYAWSPDGRFLVFAIEQKVAPDIFIARADGKGTVRLTNDYFDDSWPTWTPDGSRVIFASNREKGRQLFSIDLSGRVLQKITFDPLRFLSNPVFSPNGTQLAFVSQRSNAPEDIECMNADGTNRHLVTKNNRDDGDPRWLPDGSRITYSSWRYANGIDKSNCFIYSVDPNFLNTKVLAIQRDSMVARPAPGSIPASAPSTTTKSLTPSAPAS